METWAHCSTCDRWFYGGHEPGGAYACPVCGEPSTRLEERDNGDPATPRH